MAATIALTFTMTAALAGWLAYQRHTRIRRHHRDKWVAIARKFAEAQQDGHRGR